MKGNVLAVALAIPFSFFAGCSSADTADLPEVDWGEYASDVQDRIDGLANSADCAGLQTQFDNADANGSVDLMSYIDVKLRDAGCY
ncbi:hypothetical protein [Nocardioides mesophilus]|uniref:Lipoprotein n=1 Tax=Nocardioides mesophilus TaxID=433659 RepID=A0A7G9RG73_9ACTN|nr:hypothetical protein [Nocardioides mesophilus]QNN54598.1 hypothetical protein H9L09_09995 [Nocardioides mesophilus]